MVGALETTHVKTGLLELENPEQTIERKCAPWEDNPYGVVSLLDMLRTNAFFFASVGESMAEMRCLIDKFQRSQAQGPWTVGQQTASVPDKAVSEQIRLKFFLLLDEMEEHCKAEELQNTHDFIEHYRMLYGKYADEHNLKLMCSALTSALETLNVSYLNELRRQVYLHISSDKLKFYYEGKDRRKRNVFGDAVDKAFPNIKEEVYEAGNCLALERWTASVFHCMRTLELGLQALATELNITFSGTLDLQNWQNIIESIESEILKLEKTPKSRYKSETLKFFSGAAMQFRWFKEAWRNHVAHVRETYDEGKAVSILTHVREFMQQLASGGLHENQ
jgi:hypothetical protein